VKTPGSGYRELEPFEAFNLFAVESLLVLDAGSDQPTAILPGGAWCETDRPLLEAAAHAREHVMSTFAPDDGSSALLLRGDGDGDVERADQVSKWLLETHCRRVYCTSRAALIAQYSFLFVDAISSLPVYPNEIVPGKLFLGSYAASNEMALEQLKITHVVSIVERSLEAPHGREHLLCQIPDDDAADINPVFAAALPFISKALEAGGRVLVHCERGASRSVSVVVAHLLAKQPRLTVLEALEVVKAQRSCAQPNAGFLLALESFEATLRTVGDKEPSPAKKPRVALA